MMEKLLSAEPGTGLRETIVCTGAKGAALGRFVETEPAASGGDGREAEQVVAAAEVDPTTLRRTGSLPRRSAPDRLPRGRVRAQDNGRL